MPALRFPSDLAPGPVRDLLLWMHQLHGLAGAPSVREMAEAAGCSRHKIHEMFTSAKCPRDGATLFDLARWLGRRGPRPQLRDEDQFFDELEELWRAATRFAVLRPPAPLPGQSGPRPTPPPSAPEPSASAASSVPAPSLPAPSVPEPSVPEPAERAAAAGHGGPPAPPAPPVLPVPSGGPRAGGAVPSGPDDAMVARINAWRARISGGAAPPRRPDAMPDLKRSRALLVANGRFDHLEDIGQGPEAAKELAAVLTAPSCPAFGHADLALDEEDPRSVLRRVQRAADEAEDVLFLYFAGHGLVSSRGELLLATASTEPGADYTALRYDDIRAIVSTTRAERSLLVLDACYSGRALDVMGTYAGMQDAPSTYLMASAGATRVALAPGGAPLFTRQLIEVLRDGDPEAPVLLSVTDVYRVLAYRAQRDGFPLPQLRANEAVNPLVLARNAAVR